MKRSLIVPTFILVGIMLACFSTKAGTFMSPSEEGEIPVELRASGPIVDPNSPRAPMQIPVSCLFDEASESLYFLFLFPMGDVTITLTEASAGVVSTDEYSTASCLVSIPVPASGAYEITLVLESGAEYIGQFNY